MFNQLEYQKNRIKERKLAGLCLSCGAEPYRGRQLCFWHSLEMIAAMELGSRKEAKFLQELLCLQENRCFYCRTLIGICDNAHLGHMKPASRFPELAHDKNNVRWLCRPCNRAMSDMTHDEFIFYISAIYHTVRSNLPI